MAITLGSLVVSLEAQTAKFLEGMDRASQISKKTAREIEGAFSTIGNAAERALSPFGEVGARIGTILSSIGSNAATAAHSLSALGGAAGAAAGAIGGIAAAAAAASAGTIGIAAHAAEGAARIHELSLAAGVSVETISGLSAVAKTVGVGVDQLAKGLERMAKSALQAATAGPNVQNIYTRLGVSVKDANGQLKSSEEIFTEVASKIAALGPGAQATAAAIGVFGRAGAELLPVLLKGGDQIEQLTETARKLGAVLDTETADAAARFKENIETIKLAGEGLQNQLLKGLLPALQLVTTQISEGFQAPDSQLRSFVDGLVLIAKGFVFMAEVAANTLAQLGNDIRAAGAEVVIYGRTILEVQNRIQQGFLSAHPLEGYKEAFKALKDGVGQAGAEFEIFRAENKRLSEELDATFEKIFHPKPFIGPPKPLNVPANLDLSVKDDSFRKIQDKIGELQRAVAGIFERLDLKTAEDKFQRLDIEFNKAKFDLIEAFAKAGPDAVKLFGSSLDVLNIKLELLRIKAKDIAASELSQKIIKDLGARDEVRKEKGFEIPEAITALPQQTPVLPTLQIDEATAAMARFKASTKEQNDLLVRLYEDGISASGRYNTQLEKLNFLYQKGLVTVDVYYRTVRELQLKHYEDTDREIKQWDTWAFKLGTTKQAFSALFNELVLQGKNLQEKLFGSLLRSVDELNGELAKIFTGDKTNFAQVAKNLEQSFVKANLESLEGKLGGVLQDKLGLKIPGLDGGKPDGSEGKPFHVVMSKGAGLLGGAAGGGKTGGLIDKLTGTIDLGSILGGSGDTPDGSQSNPLYVKMAGNGLGGGGGLSSLFGGGSSSSDSGGGGGGFADLFAGLFGGGLAGGGDVMPGKAYLVGEKHPEIFLPRSSGTIIPRLPASRDSRVLNMGGVHFHGIKDADTFKRSQSQTAAHWQNEAANAARRNH